MMSKGNLKIFAVKNTIKSTIKMKMTYLAMMMMTMTIIVTENTDTEVMQTLRSIHTALWVDRR